MLGGESGRWGVSAVAQTPRSPMGAVYINEELRIGTIIANIPEDAHLDEKYDRALLGRLRYQFLTTPKLDKEYFAINEQTGTIQTTERVDRDSLCPRMEECVVKFDVAVQPIDYFEIIKVQVVIQDINDNQPVFPQRSMSLDISESAVAGTSFVIPAANDPDSGVNGVQKYELVQTSGKFDLQVSFLFFLGLYINGQNGCHVIFECAILDIPVYTI